MFAQSRNAALLWKPQMPNSHRTRMLRRRGLVDVRKASGMSRTCKIMAGACAGGKHLYRIERRCLCHVLGKQGSQVPGDGRSITNIGQHECFLACPRILANQKSAQSFVTVQCCCFGCCRVENLGFDNQGEVSFPARQVDRKVGSLLDMRSVKAEAFLSSNSAQHQLTPKWVFPDQRIQSSFQ